MKLLKLLVVSASIFLSQSYNLPAMQLNYINKQSNLNQHNINEQNSNIFGQSNQTGNTDNNTGYKLFQNFDGQWNRDDIKNLFKDIKCNLKLMNINDVFLYYNNEVLKTLGCDDDGLIGKSVEKYVRNLIKNIVSDKNFLEENFMLFKFNTNNNLTDEKTIFFIFSIIIEKYIDKYFVANQIDLNSMLKSSVPSGEMLKIVQDHHERIYDFFKYDLDSIKHENFDKIKYNYVMHKQDYTRIIADYILDKLTIPLEEYFVYNVENTGWNTYMQKYQKSPHYIKKRLVPQIFEDNIIFNNISRYTLNMKDFINQYNDKTLQEKWEEFVLGYHKVHGNESIKEISGKFLDPELQNYAYNKYIEYLTNRIKNDIKESIINKIKEKIVKKVEKGTLENIRRENILSSIIKKEILNNKLKDYTLDNLLKNYTLENILKNYTLENILRNCILDDILENCKILNDILQDYRNDNTKNLVTSIYNKLISNK